MLKAYHLKQGDELVDVGNRLWRVVDNIVGDVLLLQEITSSDNFNGIHLFYDDLEDVVYTKDVFEIDLR